MNEYPPFPGFRKEGLDFLRELSQNNERDWFKPRKTIYEDEILWPFRCLIAELTREAAARDLPFSGDPKKAIFRIYRDTRFSKDKRPYKTHAGGVLSPSGERDPHGGGLYIHVEPGASFVIGGFWRPETARVRAWRGKMASAPAVFLGVVKHLEKNGLAFETDESLKRMPRGFEVDEASEIAPYMKWKSFMARKNFTDEELGDSALTATLLDVMKQVMPLIEYGSDL